MMTSQNHAKTIVDAGIWPIYRYDPRLVGEGKNPFQLDAREPDYSKIEQFMYSEVRFKTLQTADPARAATLLAKERSLVERRWKEYKYLSERTF